MKPKARLELVGRLPREPGGRVGYLALFGDLIFLVNDDGLQLVDVTDPAAPAVAGSYRPRAVLDHVAVTSNHAFVVENDKRLRAIEVSDPTRPRKVGAAELPEAI